MKVNDREFLVKLSNPESTFPNRLGYTAYAPLPKVAFKDMKVSASTPLATART